MNRSRQIVNINWLIGFIIAFVTYGCVKAYRPSVTTINNNYLVVEGLINISDSTYIKLSRTVIVNAATTVNPELKATITIESNTGNSYPLKEVGKGLYVTPNLNLSAANQYRLRIRTSSGNTYASDFAETKVSPPIDSVTWKVDQNELKIFANSHDTNNNTRYYRWGFSETWRFNSDYNSILISDGLNVRFRLPSESVYSCFGTDTSSNISLGSTTQLTNDVLTGALVNTISPDAEKIGIRYSIEVKQYALTKDAYDYWALLKKNTENLGSIFDSQPSASIGNLHNINIPSEVVIGYISAGTITKQRIFIDKTQLPNWVTKPFYPIDPDCDFAYTWVNPITKAPAPKTDELVNFLSVGFQGGEPAIPLSCQSACNVVTNTTPLNVIKRVCVDCTTRGSKNQPAYWH